MAREPQLLAREPQLLAREPQMFLVFYFLIELVYVKVLPLELRVPLLQL